MTEDANDRLRSFLLRNLDNLASEGGSSTPGFHSPGFQVTPREYIAFAEEELARDTAQSRINCVGHLKRAADCQLDLFLHAYNLFEFTRKQNLKFGAKLAFLGDIALITSRSLERFVRLRNQMEHEYAVPDIPDLEVYFDLVQAFVSVLEAAPLYVPTDGDREFSVTDGKRRAKEIGGIVVSYKRDITTVSVEWDENGAGDKSDATPADRGAFAYLFKVYVLLGRLSAFETTKYIRSLL